MNPINRSTPVSPGWFAVAVQALAYLARSEGVCPSRTLAGTVDSHAVFTRRVLSQLVRAGLVAAREGRDGGYRLARHADDITLADVYRAVQAAGATEQVPVELAPACDARSGMHLAFAEIVAETDERIIEVLQEHTIAALL